MKFQNTLLVSLILTGLSCKQPPKSPNFGRGESSGPNVDDVVVEPGPIDIDNVELDPKIVATKDALLLGAPVAEAALAVMSHSQLENALRVVLKSPDDKTLINTNMPTFEMKNNFDNDIESMRLNYDFVEAYGRAAGSVVDNFINKSEAYKGLIPQNAPQGGIERAKAIVAPLLTRAYRGNVTDEEVNQLSQQFLKGSTSYAGDGFDKGGLKAIIPGIIFSPKFIYREQFGEPSGKDFAINSTELASRLSASLWNSIPDDAILNQAKDLKASDSEAYKNLISVMIKDPKFDAQVTRFNMYALRANYIHLIARNDETWNDATREMIRKETSAFFQHVTKKGKGLTEILTAPYAFATDASAKFYGVESPGPEPKQIELDPKKRLGFYGQVGFSAYYGNGTGKLSIRRAASIVNSLICTNSLSGDRETPMPVKTEGDITNRQSIGKATDICGGACHMPVLNPIAYAFEHLDNNGQWQEKEDKLPIDAAAKYVFSEDREMEYNGAGEFSEKLAGMYEAHRCYSSKVFQYVFGREANAEDADLIDAMAKTSYAGGGTKTLFVRAVTSKQFRKRIGGQ